MVKVPPQRYHPPGPLLQKLNALLHRKPFSFVFYGCFWSFFLVVLSPVAGVVLLLFASLRLLSHFACVRPPRWPRRKATFSEDDRRVELAILCTGCDTGIGFEYVRNFAANGGESLGDDGRIDGVVLFAGCLDVTRLQSKIDGDLGGASESVRIVPLRMDVTSEEEVTDAFRSVRKWLSDGDADGRDRRSRYLHCVVNNAGIGAVGRTDFFYRRDEKDGSVIADLTTYRRIMEVNYFGMVRVTMHCLPILKEQSKMGYDRARMLNITSMAGLFSSNGMAPYSGSKFAAEAFTTSLRHEMQPWNVQVAAVSPSFHNSVLTDTMGEKVVEMWNGLPGETRAEYGSAFFYQMYRDLVEIPRKLTWNVDNVTRALAKATLGRKIPARMCVGMDGMYGLLAIRHLPVWLQDLILNIFVCPRKVKPAAMVKAGKLE